MARADLLIDLVASGARGERALFRKTLEAMVAEERAKQHHVLADRLAAFLSQNGNGTKDVNAGPSDVKGAVELRPVRRLADLVLPPQVVKACEQMIEEHNRVELLRSHGLEPRHRVLLIGPPGNGKTTLAEALASELAVPLLVVRYQAVIASYLGETGVRLSRLFDDVRTRRCVLFFDEFDVIGKERGDPHETGEIKRVVSSLLLQVDELPSHVIVVTATNHPELLDRAVWRRFQVRLQLPPPTQAQAAEWFRQFEARLGLKLGVSPETISKRLRGLSYSELEAFAENARRRFVLSLPEADMKRIVFDELKLRGAQVGERGGRS